ncbi:hypothetical protein [Kitasatospora sp. NPDC101183]|uniref:hypothetical protein n=1 Tax=Kitasatospora sp. NPDC101183 TaxID=3364100 RepID=UPI00380156E4
MLQEQNQPAAPPTVTAELYAELRARFPLLMDPSAPRPSQDEKFTRSIRLLCAGFAAPPGWPPAASPDFTGTCGQR